MNNYNIMIEMSQLKMTKNDEIDEKLPTRPKTIVSCTIYL